LAITENGTAIKINQNSKSKNKNDNLKCKIKIAQKIEKAKGACNALPPFVQRRENWSLLH